MITGFYAALITIVFVVLSARVIRYRRGNQISLGDGDDGEMRRRVRAQGNCAEYAPLGLILMTLVELQSGPFWLIHATGTLLVLGRVVHGIAFSRGKLWMAGRVGGMIMTFTAIGLLAVVLMWLALS